MQKEAGLKQRLVAIKANGKSPPLRAHYGVFAGDAQVGELTSGTQSPSLGIGIGLGYLDIHFRIRVKKLKLIFGDEDLPRLSRKNRYTKSDASSR